MVALALFMLVVYVLAHHAIGSSREGADKARRDEWSERWLRVLFGLDEAPKGTLPRAGKDALIDVAETVTGPEAAAVRRLLVSCGVQQSLLQGLRKRRMAVRLESLEGLAKARLEGALPEILTCMTEGGHQAIKALATRAGARTLSAMAPGHERRHLSVSFGEALALAGLPPGVVEEALLLAEDAGVPAARYLLVRPTLDERTLKATLDAVGRSMFRELSPSVVAHGHDEDPEIRAASLRAMGRLQALPPKGEELILSSLHDAVGFVRVQATRALKLIRPELSEVLLFDLLGDDSWWVRKAAAEGLLDLGSDGVDELVRAAASHSDRYARDMASQVLRDRSSKVRTAAGAAA